MPKLKFEDSLRQFLKESTIAYAEGAIDDEEIDEGLHAGAFSSGSFTITDIYKVSPDTRVYSGTEEVTYKDVPVWRAGYTGTILRSVPKRDVPKVLGIYGQVLRDPAEELPIRGPRKAKIGEYEYSLDSLRGPLTVARFAVAEEIRMNGRRIYTGDIHGSRIR